MGEQEQAALAAFEAAVAARDGARADLDVALWQHRDGLRELEALRAALREVDRAGVVLTHALAAGLAAEVAA
jgi:chlorite dismutase